MQESDNVYEDPNWEAYHFEENELSITKSIVARGQFGASYVLGKIQPTKNMSRNISRMTMMKSCIENEEGKCYNGLKSEMNILYDLCHTNVLQLLGYCLEQNYDACKLILVFECCSNGNLIKVLQKGRPYYNCGAYCPKKPINNEILSLDICLNFCEQDLLKWATEICRGMEYLAFKGVIHGDLAARNVLLTHNWTAKIGNFGIAQRQHRQESYVKSLPKDVLPFAWMAPETIQNFAFSQKSDVFSYGITLWEIYTLGEIPYKDMNVEIDANFFVHLLQNLRPSKPEIVNKNMWDLMKSCWAFNPDLRPTFSKIKTFLDRSLLLSKSRLGSTSATVSDHHEYTSNPSPSVKEIQNGKSVSFSLQAANPGFIKKCFCVADSVLTRTHVKSTN